jgi:hypothetical protein
MKNKYFLCMAARLIILVFSCIVFIERAEARVFDLKSERVAIYLGGTFGSSNASDSAYGSSSGTGTLTDKKVQTATSGEVGLFLAFDRFNLRIGGEYLMPRELKGINGTDANGNALFSLDSSIGALVPMVNVELLPYKGQNTRALLGFGYGVAIASFDNQYTMTSAGKTALNVNDFKESATGVSPLLQTYLGFEFLFADSVTATIQGGYRWCNIKTSKSTEDATAITGAQKKGDDVVNMDGGPRSMDLSGGFVGINFRFYL